MKKSITLVACALFAFASIVGVAQNDTKGKTTDAKAAPTAPVKAAATTEKPQEVKKTDPKKGNAVKADSKKVEAPKDTKKGN